MKADIRKVVKTDAQWRALLTPEQYHICRAHGTERAFSGRYYRHQEPGAYHCVCCGSLLFLSRYKYDAECGWPSFWEPAAQARIATFRDESFGMLRTEVRCETCDAHLGHLFHDGPEPSGLRYCINSAALDFVPGA